VPHFKVDVGDGFTGVNVNDLVINDSVDTFLVLSNITSDVLAADVYISRSVSKLREILPSRNTLLTVRALCDVRGQDTGVVTTEEGRGIGVHSVSETSFVVRCSQNGVEVTFLQAALGPGLLERSSSAGDIALVNAAGLQLGGAVTEISTLHGAEELATLSYLLRQIMAGVC
jgi:hypothetical protein